MTSMANGVGATLNPSETVRSTGRSTPLVLILGTVLAPLFTLLLAGCVGPPPHNDRVFLSYTKFDWGCEKLNFIDCPKLTDEAAASAYYQSIGAEDANGNPNFNLEGWKQLYGYYNATPVRAIYGNKLDLLLGRDMNCWQPQGTNQVACYVTNYTKALLGDDIELAVNDAATGIISRSTGTVAMLYDPNGIGYSGQTVAFYAFGQEENGDQPLIRSLALDQEGLKTVPGMCMACHSGGDHENAYHANNFLPFDVQSFHFNSVLRDDSGSTKASPFDLDGQQEAFRQLNALVLKTTPMRAIKNFINGLYAGNVNTPGATVPDDTYIPAGWDVDKTSRNIYRHVYRKYCRTCHLAQGYNQDGENLAFESFSDFQGQEDAILRTMCGFKTMAMPNAQVPYGRQIAPSGLYEEGIGFWEDAVAKSDLKQYFESKGTGTCF